MNSETAEIQHMFRYYYQNKWCPESIFAGKSRRWIQAFNNLIKQGFIEKKKKNGTNTDRWKAEWPKEY